MKCQRFSRQEDAIQHHRKREEGFRECNKCHELVFVPEEEQEAEKWYQTGESV